MQLSELKTRDDIGHVLNSLGLTGSCAEIGVEYGRNAERILETAQIESLILVDAWQYIEGHDPKGFGTGYTDWGSIYAECLDRVGRFGTRARIMRLPSSEAAELVDDESLDFVYIDANHMSPYIDNDINIWFPKVKPGGIIGGHDYYDRKIDGVFQCDVKSVVDKRFGTEIHVTEDDVPSWYVLNQARRSGS